MKWLLYIIKLCDYVILSFDEQFTELDTLILQFVIKYAMKYNTIVYLSINIYSEDPMIFNI